ncbi:MAG: DNA cytosine methyltransferase [Bacteroidia bacterium]|jgi:DNA (cytosine-5)-methyltransferase 1
MILVIDLFCGAGGVTTGFEQAELFGERVAKVIACVNHDEMAIASHETNHPDAVHFTEDIKKVKMKDLELILHNARIQYPNAIVLLWASLECTNFSKAKGGLPRNADSRSLADFMPWYVESLKPDYVGIENVVEFMAWGPLDDAGKPISRKCGIDYTRWVNEMKSLNGGYEYDWKELNAADYGAHTSRKRYFGLFAANNLPIVFPKPTHAKKQNSGLFETKLKPWKPVREVLDLDDKGVSIFARKKPLSEKTLERIHAGLIKFVAGGKDAFIAKYYSGKPEGKCISIDGPAGTVTCIDSQSIVHAEFMVNYNHSSKVDSIEKPNPSLTTKDRHGLVSPAFIAAYYGNGHNCTDIDKPAPTIRTKDGAALVQPQFIMRDFSGGGEKMSLDNPAGSVMPSPKMNLVSVEPFIMNTHFNNVGSDINRPANTITANRKWPYLINMNSSTAPAIDTDRPAPTITSVRTHYLINPAWFNKGASSIDIPSPTIIARQDKTPLYLATTENGEAVILIYESDSEFTRKIKEFMAMYGIVDIYMRMLKIIELLKIQGFPDGYILKGTQTQQKKYIGNSVVPKVPKAWAEELGRTLELEEVA